MDLLKVKDEIWKLEYKISKADIGQKCDRGYYRGPTLEWPALWRIKINSLHNEGIYK